MPLGRGGTVPSITPTHGHFVLSPVSLALRDPHRTEKKETVNSLVDRRSSHLLCREVRYYWQPCRKKRKQQQQKQV